LTLCRLCKRTVVALACLFSMHSGFFTCIKHTEMNTFSVNHNHGSPPARRWNVVHSFNARRIVLSYPMITTVFSMSSWTHIRYYIVCFASVLMVKFYWRFFSCDHFPYNSVFLVFTVINNNLAIISSHVASDALTIACVPPSYVRIQPRIAGQRSRPPSYLSGRRIVRQSRFEIVCWRKWTAFHAPIHGTSCMIGQV